MAEVSMKRPLKIFILSFVLVSVTILLNIPEVTAQERAFTLPWSVIGSGGMGGSTGSYTIHSTLGQPVAGAVDGGSYHLTSGFWTEVLESIEAFFNFLPLIVR
jgi:hypothetical protein